MRKFICLFVCFAVFCPCAIQALSKKDDSAASDSTRIQRLETLCKLWGAVKFFHPALAYEDIDWDAALVNTISLVNEADTHEEYVSAVEDMLACLDDPNTYVVRVDTLIFKGVKVEPEKSQPYIHWTADSIPIVVATDYVQFTDFSKQYSFQQLFAEVSQFETVILDVRAPADSVFYLGMWYLHYFVMNTIPALLSEDVAVASTRHLMYSGYPPQRGGTSGGYYSAFVTKHGQAMKTANENSKTKRIVFLVNEGSIRFSSLCAGLQSAGLAIVVKEDAGEKVPGDGNYYMGLSDSATAVVCTEELVCQDGTIGFQPDLIVPYSQDTPIFSNPAVLAAIDIARGKEIEKPGKKTVAKHTAIIPDNPYSEMTYPTLEYRMLALFRFWNVIHYFYPYKHLLDTPWDDILPMFIPRFEAASDSLEYNLAIGELRYYMQDTHCYVSSPILRGYYGSYMPPVEVQYIQNKTVVTRVPDSVTASSGIERGDIILAVDGEEISQRRDRLAKTLAASTPQAMADRIHQNVLRGPNGSVAALKMKKENGKEVELEIPRSIYYYPYEKGTPVFQVLPEGYGYIDLDRLTIAEVDSALEVVKNTDGLILDMRGYPNGTAWTLAPRLAEEKAVAARFQRPELHSPDSTWNSIHKGMQIVEPSGEWRYTGKVVMLINEDAISQAEHTCLYMEAATDVTFIGTPTNGANGDVTNFVLPGGISVSFTGHDVRHGDGRQLQRVGIQPDIFVEPTIEGIRAGRDEILEKAIKFLDERASKRKPD